MDFIDHGRLKKLRLRVELNDPAYPHKKKLKVRGQDLGKLPRELFSLEELEVLDLSPEREACLHFRLVEVPPAIGKLVNLSVLLLDTNEIMELPSEICLLHSLERISLSNNQLRNIPVEFSNLQRLESCHIANNKFDVFPSALVELANLRFLDLSDNEITSLPDDISRLADTLESLLLFINKLEELPDSLCDLRELRCLWLGQNLLRRLPREFGRLRRLDWGFRHTQSTVIDGNPINEPPIEVCKMGVVAIADYFERHTEETDDESEEEETLE